MFRALDLPKHVKNLLSLELTGAWVNEAREIPWTIVSTLQGRVGRFPSKTQGGATWAGLWMDTNPPDEDSWWYDLFEVRCPDTCIIYKQPGGLDEGAENLTNLPANYYTQMAAAMTDSERTVYVDGQYGYVKDGKPIFPEYNDTVHCPEVGPEYMEGVVMYRGWDFGLTPACVLSQVQPSGKLVVLDEVVADDMGIDRHSDDVLMHCEKEYGGATFVDVGDPAGEQRAQTDERTCFEILQGKGIDIQGGDQSLMIRFESVRKPLTTMTAGEPGFAINKRARMTRKGLAGKYQFRRLQTAAEKYADVPDKNEYSHPVEAFQYSMTKVFGATVRGMSKRSKGKARANRVVMTA